MLSDFAEGRLQPSPKSPSPVLRLRCGFAPSKTAAEQRVIAGIRMMIRITLDARSPGSAVRVCP
jgi:hypothetical protein